MEKKKSIGIFNRRGTVAVMVVPSLRATGSAVASGSPRQRSIPWRQRRCWTWLENLGVFRKPLVLTNGKKWENRKTHGIWRNPMELRWIYPYRHQHKWPNGSFECFATGCPMLSSQSTAAATTKRSVSMIFFISIHDWRTKNISYVLPLAREQENTVSNALTEPKLGHK